MGTFNVLGFPVTVRPLFFVVTVVLALGRLDDPPALALWIAIVTVSILIHELGHALAFKKNGREARIELHGMGGLTYGEGGTKPFTPLQDAAVSAAGPGASYVVALIVYLGAMALDPAQRTPLVERAIRDLLWVNAGWATINLLPIYPLDGGQILHALLRLKTPGRAKAIALTVSVVVAAAGLVLAWRAGMTWAAILAFWFGASNVSELTALKRAASEGGEREKLAAAAEAFNRGDLDAALSGAREVRAAVAKGELHDQARQVAGIAALRKGIVSEAWDELAPLPDRLLNRELLDVLARSLFERGDFVRAEAASARVYEVYGAAEGAYNAACSRARREDADGALKWIELAIDAGFRDGAQIDGDADLAKVRVHPRWDAVRARMGR